MSFSKNCTGVAPKNDWMLLRSRDPPQAIDRTRRSLLEPKQVSSILDACQATLLRCCCVMLLVSAACSMKYPTVPGRALFVPSHKYSMVSKSPGYPRGHVCVRRTRGDCECRPHTGSSTTSKSDRL